MVFVAGKPRRQHRNRVAVQPAWHIAEPTRMVSGSINGWHCQAEGVRPYERLSVIKTCVKRCGQRSLHEALLTHLVIWSHASKVPGHPIGLSWSGLPGRLGTSYQSLPCFEAAYALRLARLKLRGT